MVSFSFKVVAALAAALVVQANEHELEIRDWEARRLAPRNFELITTKVTMLVPKGSYKTVTKYKTVTVTDCGAGGITTTDTFPITSTSTYTTPTDTFTSPTDTFTTPTDTFTLPTVTDTAIPTSPGGTLTGLPTDTLTGLPTGTLTGVPTATTDTLTGAPIPTNTSTGVPIDTLIPITGGGGNATTDPLATPTTTDPLASPTINTADPFGNATLPTTTFGIAGANATADPLATTTTATLNLPATGATTPAAAAAPLDIFGPSTETEDVTITTDPTAPTPTAPSIVKRGAALVI